MSINLTDKQYLMLSQLAYLDFATKDEFYDPDNGYVGQTLGQMAERLLQLDATGQPRVFDSSGGLNDVEYHALLRSITEDSALSNLTLTGFENKNTTTGFVAYAFENTSTGDTCFAFRGSEGGPPVGSIDWLDNYLYGAANTSIQFTDVENFVNTYKSSGQIYVTGHSKGGANAAYACAAIEGCTGVTFDAPGIGETLNLTQVASLNNSGLVNYVAQGDLVGALLFHPETVKFVQQLGSFWAAGEIQGTGLFDGHYMQAFAFDGANLIEASRTIESLIIEGYSKTIWFLKNFNTNNPDAVVQLLSELGVADDIGDFINGISKTVTDINSYLQNSMSVGYEFFKILGNTLYREFIDIILWKSPFDSLRSLFSKAEVTRSPILLDLDGDGVIKTLGTDAGIHFDHDGNGFKELSGWVAPGDGVLMLDRDADGSLDNGSELFGNFTPLANGMLAVNGFQALAQFDSNGDGKIDASDPIWSQLKVWQHDPEATDSGDPDSSGIFTTLDALGIQSINTGYANATFVDANGNAHKQIGSFTRDDGTTSAAEDVWFQTDNMYTIANEWLDVPDDIAALPDLQGYGNQKPCHTPLSFLTGDRG